MKKNVLMRAASGLLVATMLTTCAISGTFAKYVTQDNGGDIARVAKWGVIVQVEGDLYGANYLNGTANTATDEIENLASVSSKLNGGDNLVAPGTNSADSPYSFSINGTPEVDSQTTIKIMQQNVYLNKGTYGVMVPVETGVVTATNFDELIAGTAADEGLFIYNTAESTYTKIPAGSIWDSYSSSDFYTLEDYVVFDGMDTYYPVYYKMNGPTTYTSYTEQDNDLAAKAQNTLQTVSETILNKVNSGTKTWTWDDTVKAWSATTTSAVVEHNVNLGDHFALEDQSIAWEWEFEDADSVLTDMEEYETPAYNISQQDQLDTILGNLMAERLNDFTDVKLGKVVKLTDAADAYRAPVSYLDDTVNHTGDYCLDTQFNIDILVEQMD